MIRFTRPPDGSQVPSNYMLSKVWDDIIYPFPNLKDLMQMLILAKHAIWLAKSEAVKEEFATGSPDSDGVIRIAKQKNHTNQHIVGENCVCNDAGDRALIDEDKMTVYVKFSAGWLYFMEINMWDVII